MTADDDALAASLAMLGEGLDDAELDRRVSRFQDRLRRLRDDPAEAARIDAMVLDAERGEQDLDAVSVLEKALSVFESSIMDSNLPSAEKARIIRLHREVGGDEILDQYEDQSRRRTGGS